jgi:hypothetical protein
VLRYAAELDGRWVAVLGFGSAALSCAAGWVHRLGPRPAVRTADRSLEHLREERVNVGADRGRTAGEGDVVAEEGVPAVGTVGLLREAEAADDAARGDNATGLVERRTQADDLDDDEGAVPSPSVSWRTNAQTKWGQFEIIMTQWRRIEALTAQVGPFIWRISRTTMTPIALE